MIYAVLDESGNVVEERVYDDKLPKGLHNEHKNGNPILAPLVAETISHDPDTQRPAGFSYKFEGDHVAKRPLFVSLTPEERAERKTRMVKETKKAALPDYEDGLEVVARVLLAIAERYAMTVDPADPRTTLNVTMDDINKLKGIVAVCENCK